MHTNDIRSQEHIDTISSVAVRDDTTTPLDHTTRAQALSYFLDTQNRNFLRRFQHFVFSKSKISFLFVQKLRDNK
jgi:hypothetical protein